MYQLAQLTTWTPLHALHPYIWIIKYVCLFCLIKRKQEQMLLMVSTSTYTLYACESRETHYNMTTTFGLEPHELLCMMHPLSRWNNLHNTAWRFANQHVYIRCLGTWASQELVIRRNFQDGTSARTSLAEWSITARLSETWLPITERLNASHLWRKGNVGKYFCLPNVGTVVLRVRPALKDEKDRPENQVLK